MNNYSTIFNKTLSLFIGTNTNFVAEYPDFIHISSYLKDYWYNFIVPKAEIPENLDFNTINKIIDGEYKKGVSISYYVNQSIEENYKETLDDQGYNTYAHDIYLTKELHSPQQLILPDGYTITHEYALAEVIAVLEKCFPEWESEKEYSKVYEDYKTKGQPDRMFETFVVKYKSTIVGAGSIVLDKKLNLAYLHNTGIAQEYRRKGLHTALINERCNFAYKNGVTETLSLADPNDASYASLTKNSFVNSDAFTLFMKI